MKTELQKKRCQCFHFCISHEIFILFGHKYILRHKLVICNRWGTHGFKEALFSFKDESTLRPSFFYAESSISNLERNNFFLRSEHVVKPAIIAIRGIDGEILAPVLWVTYSKVYDALFSFHIFMNTCHLTKYWRYHSYNTFPKFSKKLFLNPRYAHLRVRIRG